MGTDLLLTETRVFNFGTHDFRTRLILGHNGLSWE